MKTSKNGIDLIVSHEGLRLTAYKCPAGVWTIGYGHTGGVKQGQTITKQQALDFLSEDLQVAEEAVSKQLPNLNQNQFDALVSFVFNIGSGGFQRSVLLKKAKVNAADLSIADEFARWNKSNNKVLPGLVNRRTDEAELYFK